MSPTVTVATMAIFTTIELFIWLKASSLKQDKFVVRCVGLIVIVSPVTRREYVPIGSTATSMSPTVTVATVTILTTIELFIWQKS